jgi:SnoaL-like domain
VDAISEVVRAWIQATNSGRLEDQLALAHPEFKMTEARSLPGAARVSGRDGLRGYGRGWARNWSEWHWHEHELVEFPPDRVLLDSTLRLRGLRSSIWVEHRWSYVFLIRDGMVLRMDGFNDRDEALARTGLRPA